jgi:hypothetical protein
MQKVSLLNEKLSFAVNLFFFFMYDEVFKCNNNKETVKNNYKCSAVERLADQNHQRWEDSKSF